MKAKFIHYTDEDDRPDPAMTGLVMIAIGQDGEIPVHVLDRIPEGAATILCDVINGTDPAFVSAAYALKAFEDFERKAFAGAIGFRGDDTTAPTGA